MQQEKRIAIYYDGAFDQCSECTCLLFLMDRHRSLVWIHFEEAEQLASTIRIGGLNLELEEFSSNVVGAQLGDRKQSAPVLMAGAIGLAIVFVFMCIVYLLPGFASSTCTSDLYRADCYSV